MKLLKDSIMETSYRMGDGSTRIGDPITATRVGLKVTNKMSIRLSYKPNLR